MHANRCGDSHLRGGAGSARARARSIFLHGDYVFGGCAPSAQTAQSCQRST